MKLDERNTLSRPYIHEASRVQASSNNGPKEQETKSRKKKFFLSTFGKRVYMSFASAAHDE
jgi:hypothetical protein